MALKRTTLLVQMPDRDEPYEVPVILADQLRGELEGKKQGLDIKLSMHTTALWAWSAMCRLGHYDGPFQDFKADCIALGSPDDIDHPESLPDVDPTQPGLSPGSA